MAQYQIGDVVRPAMRVGLDLAVKVSEAERILRREKRQLEKALQGKRRQDGERLSARRQRGKVYRAQRAMLDAAEDLAEVRERWRI